MPFRDLNVQTFFDLYRSADAMWHEMNDRFQIYSHFLRAKFNDPTCNLNDLCDVGFLLRELETKFDDLRKESKRLSDETGKKIAMDWTKAGMENGDEPIADPKGEFAWARASVKKEAQLPQRGSPEWNALLNSLGIDTKNEAIVHGVIKPDWRGISKYVTELSGQGIPMPPGINRTYPVYHSVFTRNRNSPLGIKAKSGKE